MMILYVLPISKNRLSLTRIVLGITSRTCFARFCRVCGKAKLRISNILKTSVVTSHVISIIFTFHTCAYYKGMEL